MSTFNVVVRTVAQSFTYQALGTDSAAVIMAALDRFGPCYASAKPA